MTSDKDKALRAVVSSIVKWEKLLSGELLFFELKSQCALCLYYNEPRYVTGDKDPVTGKARKCCKACVLALVGHGCLDPGAYMELEHACRSAHRLEAVNGFGYIQSQRLTERLDLQEFRLHATSMRDEQYPEELKYMGHRIELMLSYLKAAFVLVRSMEESPQRIVEDDEEF